MSLDFNKWVKRDKFHKKRRSPYFDFDASANHAYVSFVFLFRRAGGLIYQNWIFSANYGYWRRRHFTINLWVDY